MNFFRNPKPYLKLMRNGLASELEYRASYYILTMSSFVTVFMEMAVLKQIYAHQEVAGTLHRSQALPFVVLGMLVRSGVSLWTLIFESIDQVRDGSFRKFLIQPLHFPSYFYAQAAGGKLVTWPLALLTILICKHLPGFEAFLPPGSYGYFFLAVACAYALTWQMYLFIIYLGFWIEEVNFLSTAFNIGMGFFTGTIIPLSWFPTSFANALKFTPFPLIGDFPVMSGLGIYSGQVYQERLIACLSWVLAFFVINIVLERKAFRRFEAFGG